MQADGEDGEKECGAGEQGRELCELDEGLVSEEDGIGREAGWEPVQVGSGPVEEVEEPAALGGFGVGWSATEVKKLEADEGEGHEGSEDFAGAAGGEPAFEPCGEHAGEEDVHQGVDGQRDECPQGEGMVGDSDSDGGGEQGEVPTTVLGVSRPNKVRRSR